MGSFLDRIITWLTLIRDYFIRRKVRQRCQKTVVKVPEKQDLEVYWNEVHAEALNTWGAATAWMEIQCFLIGRQGRVLDIACGTGPVMKILEKFSDLELYGCDISDMHIEMARKSGIPGSRLKMCDATQRNYEDNFFDYSYSIGSLEHFTEEGIVKFVQECYRTTKHLSMHHVPTSRAGKDEGWLQLDQSYFNNSIMWWVSKFKTSYKKVYVLESSWKDPISLGRWFVCIKE